MNDFSDKDEKILQVILQQIGDHPDELKYQKLNVKKLSNILKNCALSLNLLIKFGFQYTQNKSQLRFIGVEQYIHHEDEIIKLLREKKLRLILVQAAIRACFRADKDTRQTFDSDTPPFGVFRTLKPVLITNNKLFYTPWKNLMLSDKTQTTLRVKEMCDLNSFDDLFEQHYIYKCPYTKKVKKLQVYVFNNQGKEFQRIDWDGICIDKLIADIYRKCVRYQLFITIDQISSVFLSTADKDENEINFYKKCLFFLDTCFSPTQRNYHHYKMLTTLRKYEYLLNKLGNLSGLDIIELMRIGKDQCRDDLVEQHINSIVKPKVERIEKSKKICKYIKNSMLSKEDNNVDYLWKCLLCNTKNNYNFGKLKCNGLCSSCKWSEWNELYSMCPLYYLQSNQSKTFGIDPRVKPFYIIHDFGHKPYDFKKYRDIQAMTENNNHLKLSTVVVGWHDMALCVILFEKSNPLTLSDLKHLLFEFYLYERYGKNKAHVWTFGDVVFKDPNDPHILNKLSDDSTIDIVTPCYVDLYRMIFDSKVRKPVEFDKTRFDQGYYHSCCKRDNINTNNINTNKLIETSDASEVFDFEYSPFHCSTYYARHKISRFHDSISRETTEISGLLHLVKEVIKNGYETDLLPVREIVDNETSINMIDKIVHEYEMKTNTSISKHGNESIGNNGICNRLNMGLIQELSKVYNIFHEHIFESKMFHKRHQIMGYPLNCFEMLALMLYCDGNCSHDLCISQRSNTVMKKWPYFHCLLDFAITRLSQFEVHYEHIYTGICGVFVQINEESQEAIFHTNVSFSTDLNVALEFRGDRGMVIGANIKRIVNNIREMHNFHVCDVSWISSFPSEKEILCAVGSSIRIYPNLVRKRGNTQWIAFVEDELDHDKAFKSIFGTIAD